MVFERLHPEAVDRALVVQRYQKSVKLLCMGLDFPPPVSQ